MSRIIYLLNISISIIFGFLCFTQIFLAGSKLSALSSGDLSGTYYATLFHESNSTSSLNATEEFESFFMYDFSFRESVFALFAVALPSALELFVNFKQYLLFTLCSKEKSDTLSDHSSKKSSETICMNGVEKFMFVIGCMVSAMISFHPSGKSESTLILLNALHTSSTCASTGLCCSAILLFLQRNTKSFTPWRTLFMVATINSWSLVSSFSPLAAHSESYQNVLDVLHTISIGFLFVSSAAFTICCLQSLSYYFSDNCHIGDDELPEELGVGAGGEISKQAAVKLR